MKRTPRRLAFDEAKMNLTMLEQIVFAHVDGARSVEELAGASGLAVAQVELILGRLEKQGVLEVKDADDGSVGIPVDEVLARLGDVEEREGPHAHARSDENLAVREPEHESSPPPSIAPPESEASDGNETAAEDLLNYRKIYETQLHALTPAVRVQKAHAESGAILLALCFDQDPQVVKAVLDNDRAGLEHARLIAAHHHNPVGLEAICARVSLLSDTRVQRMLLRNVQLTEGLLRKILQPKRLTDIYKTSNDRDLPDRNRAVARTLFKSKFNVATSDEKFDVIWTTEGRVLQQLVGHTIDQKTAAMFCSRAIGSVMLIQSFARFPATPPVILAHILKQPLVKRQPQLRNTVLQHPNVPSEAKKKL